MCGTEVLQRLQGPLLSHADLKVPYPCPLSVSSTSPCSDLPKAPLLSVVPKPHSGLSLSIAGAFTEHRDVPWPFGVNPVAAAPAAMPSAVQVSGCSHRKLLPSAHHAPAHGVAHLSVRLAAKYLWGAPRRRRPRVGVQEGTRAGSTAGRGAGLMLAGCARCPRTMLNALLLCCGLLQGIQAILTSDLSHSPLQKMSAGLGEADRARYPSLLHKAKEASVELAGECHGPQPLLGQPGPQN